jgi:hypothetical protein
MLTTVPVSGPWTYGGYPFGLEPLTLPEPGARLPREPDRSVADGAKTALAQPTRQILGDDVEADGDRLAWFRWITGHQTSFALWRLLGTAVEDHIGDGALLDQHDIDALPLPTWQQYVDGYSAMLLYSGSCTQETYHRLIRPSMRLQHPSFSGSWAPDYVCVRKLFHDRHPVTREPAAWRLNTAIETIHRVHDRVAERLVPGGASLLRASPVKRQDWGDTAFLYDNYFLTRRDSTDRECLIAQLLRRLGAILDDLIVNGLYDVAAESEAADPNVRRIEGCMGELVRDLIQVVLAGQSADASRRPITVNR